MQKIQKHVRFLSRYKMTLLITALSALILSLSACQSQHEASENTGSQKTTKNERFLTPENRRHKLASDEVSVMTFNVENLFDTEHDVGTEDYTYLPLSKKNTPEVKAACAAIKNPHYRSECFEMDWTDDVLKFKLSQIAKTIRYVDDGKGPDILFLIEVENIKVINYLVDSELKDSSYITRALVEGPDTRGIDPGLISRFPMKSKPILHLIPYKDTDPEKEKVAKKMRGVLEVVLELPNKKELTVLVAHFPSQMNPVEWRKQAVQFVKQKMADYEKQGRAVIAGGDLNISAEEESEEKFSAVEFSSVGKVSHIVGCKDCEGSHNYRGGWSFLDVLIFGNGLEKSGLQLIPESIEVIRAPQHTKRNGTPLRFNEEKREGVSDHFPLYSRLKILK